MRLVGGRSPAAGFGSAAVALSGGGCLPGRPGLGSRRPIGRRCTSQPAALATGRTVFSLAAPAPRFLTAASLRVDGRPGPPLGLLLCDAALFVAFFNVLGPTLLLVRVTRLVATWHVWLSAPENRLHTNVWRMQTQCRRHLFANSGADKSRVAGRGEW